MCKLKLMPPFVLSQVTCGLEHHLVGLNDLKSFSNLAGSMISLDAESLVAKIADHIERG